MHPTRPHLVRAYGDREGDGMVQMSFALPVSDGALGREAARRFAAAHGLREPLVATMEPCGAGYCYFVVYGHSDHGVNLADLEVPEVDMPLLEKDEIEQRIERYIARKVVLVGACTGTDAHTVGIDAILNIKGFAGHKGLEAYKGFEVHNLGAQVHNEALLARAAALGADAVLVSQVITQRDLHKENASALITLLKERGVRDRFIMLLGGPRIDHKLALELGYDGGFGPGTLPSHVASFVVHRLLEGREGTGSWRPR